MGDKGTHMKAATQQVPGGIDTYHRVIDRIIFKKQGGRTPTQIALGRHDYVELLQQTPWQELEFSSSRFGPDKFQGIPIRLIGGRVRYFQVRC